MLTTFILVDAPFISSIFDIDVSYAYVVESILQQDGLFSCDIFLRVMPAVIFLKLCL